MKELRGGGNSVKDEYGINCSSALQALAKDEIMGIKPCSSRPKYNYTYRNTTLILIYYT